jgi:UDP-glucuronate decarboxylase
MDSDASIIGPINLGNPDEFTILELANLIRTADGLRMAWPSSEIITRPLPQDDPKQRRPDITLARDLLAWHPTTALRDGLRPTIEYFRGRM